MKIVCDLDGVLADFNSGFIRLLKRINPTVIVDATAANFPHCWNWPTAYGFTEEDESKAWMEVRHDGLFWRSLFPYATAYADLELLQKLEPKHDLYFCTSRHGATAKQQSEVWLRAQGIQNPTVVVGNNKTAFCAAIRADIIIDDLPENLLAQHVTVKQVLFRRPYNRGYHGYFSATVDSIREALSDVN